jgi:diguanylate cyclase (GGDEF)-like protein
VLFAVLSAVCVAAAGAAIVLVVRHADVARAEDAAAERAVFAAHAVLRPEIVAQDLAHPASRARARELDVELGQRVLGRGFVGVVLYGARGAPTYAGGRTALPENPGALLREALAGVPGSEVATGADGSRAYVTYVPLALASGEIGGVARLDQDYGPIAASASGFSWIVAGVLEALLVVLLVLFVPMLARAASRIRHHVSELEHSLTHDELTGLPNRQAFREATEKLLASGGNGALAVLDVDGFTDVDEALGERGGDTILVEVADRLRYELDDAVMVARFGDDEFGVLLRDAGTEDVEELAERAGRAVSTPIQVGGVPVAVTFSVGAALAEAGEDVGTLLQRATTALSIAKRPGQPSTKLCGAEVDLRDISCLTLGAELRDALANGELLVHFQPQSDLTTRRIRGVEALLRWDHPHDGLLTAGRFIGQIERSGLSKDIRRLVLERSVAQWREWHGRGVELELAINLSPVDMLDVSLPGDVEHLLDRYGLPASCLVLEITERMLVADERRARAVVDRLTGLGVRIAVDDFGTGYSSLASLRSFPVRQVKLDRSLLVGVPGDPGAEAVIGGCVEIAHGVGATVVAEGIETPEQWRFVALMGCDIAQGYIVGRPCPADELTPLLLAPNRIPLTAV